MTGQNGNGRWYFLLPVKTHTNLHVNNGEGPFLGRVPFSSELKAYKLGYSNLQRALSRRLYTEKTPYSSKPVLSMGDGGRWLQKSLSLLLIDGGARRLPKEWQNPSDEYKDGWPNDTGALCQ